jgi:hypothetical protein
MLIQEELCRCRRRSDPAERGFESFHIRMPKLQSGGTGFFRIVRQKFATFCLIDLESRTESIGDNLCRPTQRKRHLSCNTNNVSNAK